jgi:RecJ-like exonuclease
MEARSEIVMTGVQIICGDCAGEGRIPVKTFLDKNANCSQCGGQSYLLAANCALRMQHLTPLRMSQLQKSGKKVAFFAANPLVVQKHYTAKSLARH